MAQKFSGIFSHCLCGMLGMPMPCRHVDLGSALGSPIDLDSKDYFGSLCPFPSTPIATTSYSVLPFPYGKGPPKNFVPHHKTPLRGRVLKQAMCWPSEKDWEPSLGWVFWKINVGNKGRLGGTPNRAGWFILIYKILLEMYSKYVRICSRFTWLIENWFCLQIEAMLFQLSVFAEQTRLLSSAAWLIFQPTIHMEILLATLCDKNGSCLVGEQSDDYFTSRQWGDPQNVFLSEGPFSGLWIATGQPCARMEWLDLQYVKKFTER